MAHPLQVKRHPAFFLVLWFWVVGGLYAAEPAHPTKPKPAVLQISGYGFIGHQVLKRMVRTVELGGAKPDYFSSTFVEDTALVLAARVKRDGFLNPTITIRLRLADGGRLQLNAEDLLENPLPRE